MKIIIAPDSFKGTLTAAEVCEIIAQAFFSVFPGAEIHTLPLADGGDGMAHAWHVACGGELRSIEVTGPYNEPVLAEYLMLSDGTAVLETASCAGLELARPVGLNPEKTMTRGLGTLLQAVYEAGAQRVLLGLGGSGTNDAGCGMAHALGWQFFDSAGTSFCPVGGTLKNILWVEQPEKPFPLPVTAACDVQAPLFGPEGAAHVYALQKGADAAMIGRLDAGLRHIAKVYAPALADEPGAGAAGGLGFGVLAFLGGKLRPGADLLLDSAGFDALLRGAGLVVTGEGRMDAQTLQGKAPCSVLRRAKAQNAPVIGICGCEGQGSEQLLAAGFAGIFPASEPGRPLEALRLSCRQDLFASARRAAEILS